jgi:hypothetical protein
VRLWQPHSLSPGDFLVSHSYFQSALTKSARATKNPRPIRK